MKTTTSCRPCNRLRPRRCASMIAWATALRHREPCLPLPDPTILLTSDCEDSKANAAFTTASGFQVLHRPFPRAFLRCSPKSGSSWSAVRAAPETLKRRAWASYCRRHFLAKCRRLRLWHFLAKFSDRICGKPRRTRAAPAGAAATCSSAAIASTAAKSMARGHAPRPRGSWPQAGGCFSAEPKNDKGRAVQLGIQRGNMSCSSTKT